MPTGVAIPTGERRGGGRPRATRPAEPGEREQREHPGQYLEQVDGVLRGVELVRAQDLDPSCVGG